MPYEVNANINKGHRSQTKMNFKTKSEAQKYADDTNKYRPGANARVVKTKRPSTKWVR